MENVQLKLLDSHFSQPDNKGFEVRAIIKHEVLTGPSERILLDKKT